MESETTKLKERDEKHQTQLESWKAELGPRKKVRHACVTSMRTSSNASHASNVCVHFAIKLALKMLFTHIYISTCMQNYLGNE